mgnify:CR=1 FL=1
MNYHKYRVPTEEYFSNRPVLASTSRLPPPVVPIPVDAHPNETSGYGIRLASPPKIVDTTVPPSPPASSSRGTWRGSRGAPLGPRSNVPFRGGGGVGRGRGSYSHPPAHTAIAASPSSHASTAAGSRSDPLAKGKGRQTANDRDDGRSSSNSRLDQSRGGAQQNASNGATAIETVSTVAAQRERDGPPSNTVVVRNPGPQTTRGDIERLFGQFGSMCVFFFFWLSALSRVLTVQAATTPASSSPNKFRHCHFKHSSTLRRTRRPSGRSRSTRRRTWAARASRSRPRRR